MSQDQVNLYRAYIVSRRIALRLGLIIYTPFIPNIYHPVKSFLTNKGIWYIGLGLPTKLTGSGYVAIVTKTKITKKQPDIPIYFTVDELQFDIFSHVLFSPHFILEDKEKKQLEKKLDITKLPKISVNDIAIRFINGKVNDVIKINRKNSNVPFFRIVVNTL
jgi:DNA-directed RNA polymerase subunit H (RpoH/RPB5)